MLCLNAVSKFWVMLCLNLTSRLVSWNDVASFLPILRILRIIYTFCKLRIDEHFYILIRIVTY